MQVLKLVILYFFIVTIPYNSLADDTADKIRVVVFGDSLFSGYQLDPEHSFRNVLNKKLESQNLQNIHLYNGSSDGQATNVAFSRVDTVINLKPHIVIISLGSNDAFNNVPLQQIYTNLDAIIKKLRAHNIEVVLAGIRLPEGSKKEYQEEMTRMYRLLQTKYNTQLYANILEGIFGNPENVIQDGIHPNENGVKLIVDNIYPLLRTLIVKQIRKCNHNKRAGRKC